MSEISKELRFWATDDIVPADLQHLCNRAADSHDALLVALEELLRSVLDDGYDFEGNPVTDKARTAIAAAKKT